MGELIRIYMRKKGRKDTGAYLSELIGCSMPTAYSKLNNDEFDIKELKVIANELDIDSTTLGETIKTA